MKPNDDAATKKKKNKRVTNGVVVVMALLLYADLFAQPACDNNTDGTGGGAVDASAIDAPPGMDLVDASIDAPVVDAAAVVDGAVVATDPCWASAIASYNGDGGCGLGNSALTIVNGQYVLNPFGANGGMQTFTPKAGEPRQGTASNIFVFNAPGHMCTLSCVPSPSPTAGPNPTLSITCSRPSDAGQPISCTQLYSRAQ